MNKKHAGKMLVWNAGGKTHQFNKDTVIQYLRRVVAPAFREKRKRLKLQHRRGLLIWDAFGGAKAITTKEERQEWEELLNVDILGPVEMTRDSSAPVVPGGWSAPGQPNDYFHVYWHKLTMARERVIVNWHRNLLLRKALDDLVLNRFTTAASKVELEDALESDLWAWLNIPQKIVRYAWRSRGYTDAQKQAEMLNLRLEELQEEEKEALGWIKKSLMLQSIPEVLPSELAWEMDPIPGEKEKVMLIEGSPGLWHSVPEWMRWVLESHLSRWRHAMNHINVNIGKRHLKGHEPTPSQIGALEKLHKCNPHSIVFDLAKKAAVEGKLDVGEASERNYVQIVMKMDDPLTIAVGDESPRGVRLVQRTVGQNAEPKPDDASFMLKPSHIKQLLEAYASEDDGEEENLNDEDTSGDLPPDQAPLEGEDDESSEEEEDGDLVVYDVEDLQNHFHTIGKKGDLITKIKMDDTWVRVTMSTPLDAKHRLPPRKGARVERHKDTKAGAEKWQAWYPGAQPESHHRTGSTAREEVLQWCCERHAEYMNANKYEQID